MNGKNLAPARRVSFRQRASALGLGLMASFYAMASTATTPVQDVQAAIDSGKADAITIAVAVVIALWAIWSVYLMRRKG